MKIEIHDNNTNETGTYSVWYKENKELRRIILSENDVYGLLSMRQKEDFFLQDKSKYTFIVSEYDLKKYLTR